MESLNELKNLERQKKLIHWLASIEGMQEMTVQPMQGDASFRRYFRIVTATGSWVAMDAPPPQENCYPYVAIAQALRSMGLQTPEIKQADLQQGFLLLSDFGDTTYLQALNAENAETLYLRALKALSVLQSCSQVKDHSIPAFTSHFMRQEWAWHKEWFLNKLLGLHEIEAIAKLDACFERLIESAVNQPQVFMHRDYHSANLMVLPNGEVGILDFQDAFIGPVTYDVVSLLRDCYIAWPDEKVNTWALAYWELLRANGFISVDKETFIRWFDYMGIERHLKALFTFARKHVRDHQSQYLRHVPRTLQYLINVTQHYPDLMFLHNYLVSTVSPAFERQFPCAA